MFCMLCVSPSSSLVSAKGVVYPAQMFMRKFTGCNITELPLSWAPLQILDSVLPPAGQGGVLQPVF